MQNCGKRNITQTNYRILQRGVGWFTSLIVLMILFTACGGGSEGNKPPLTSAASLAGSVIFTQQVPLGTPPSDAFDGPVPEGIRYGARIVDPGDDIGNIPLPKPNTLMETGEYEFAELDSNPLAYFNLRFTVDTDLEENGSSQTSISFNIPVSLINGATTLLSTTIHRPSDSVLQVIYRYLGPDGSRMIHLRLDFVTDLLTFDLDLDGLYDDLIAIDTNHDTIADEHAPLMELLDPVILEETYGNIAGVGSNTIMIGGLAYEVWEHTNLVNAYNSEPISLSEVSVGSKADMQFVSFGGENVAVKVSLQPSPTATDLTLSIRRDGIIEEMSFGSLFVGGILFYDYAHAQIEDVLGNTVQPGELEDGLYVTVFGVRDGDIIKATKIIVTEISPPPAYIERQGTIEELVPEESPTSMTVAGTVFQLTGETVITDLIGTVVDTSALIVGNPVWVLGHESSGNYIADIIELQYTIDDEPIEPEVVVLIDDIAILGEVHDAIDQLDTTVVITPLTIASYPPAVTEPPCIMDIFIDLFWSEYLLMGLPGFIAAFPRSDVDGCSTLILIEDGYPETVAWVDYFFPMGIGGAPLEYDMVAMPPFYGAGDEMMEAFDIAEDLSDLLWSNDNVIMIYISPDIGFSD